MALYRPGPMESGMHDDFVRRKHGEARVEYPLPQLEPILKETYGVILYQEQVMQIAAAVSGLLPGRSRSAAPGHGQEGPGGDGGPAGPLRLRGGGRGVAKAKATELFNLIEKFAGYGFNKSHSAAYALVAYQTAYLKAHYPLEFLAAVLNSEINNTTALAKHIMEARDQGIELLPPDINQSDRDFTVEDGKVRYGLSGVKNVGLGAIQEILEARGPGRFESFRDFLERISLNKVNRKVLESLIQAGAFDPLQPRRSRLMAGLDDALEKTQNLKRLQATKQMSMFGGLAVSQNDDDWLPEAAPWEKSVKLAREKEALGVYLSGHPLDAHRALLKTRVKVTTADLAELPDSQEVALGVVVTSLKEKVGKKGGRLAILTVEDLAGSVEVLVFGEVYERAAPWLHQPSLPLWLKGDVLQEEQGTKLRALEIAPLESGPAALAGETGPAPPGRHRHPGATGEPQRNPGPPCRAGAGLPPFPGPPGGSRPGPAPGPGPHPFRQPGGGSQPPAGLSGFVHLIAGVSLPYWKDFEGLAKKFPDCHSEGIDRDQWFSP